jgi:hypothetical protein
MTAAEMEQAFDILYDKVTNFAAPGYTQLEKSIFLTKAQDRVVLNHYNPAGNKYKAGFEETEQRRKDLQELENGVTIISPSATQTNVLPNGVFFDLPNDCLYATSEEVTVSSTDSCLNGKRVKVKPITHDEYTINKRNPFKQPFVRDDDGLIWRLDYNTRRHELIYPSNVTISSYHLRYLMRPKPIILGAFTVNGVAGPLSCTLNNIIHDRIIDEAVKIATGITDPQVYQIKNAENQQGE